jgi:RNA recognition motif-containing protein
LQKEFLGRPLHITAYAAQELASPRAKASTANGSSGRAIQVTKASKQQGAKGFRVSVTNLPYDITSAELRDIFASVGRVVACVVNPPGHGTVTYANSQLAVAAVRDFDNAKVNHRPITVARLN